MRISELFLNRNAHPECDLLTRASYTYPCGPGLYSLLPLGNRVLQRISSIVRRELQLVGAQEVTMPLLQPRALWEMPIDHGPTRAEAFGRQMFRVRGGAGDDLVLAPTHEEVATLLGAACIRRSSELPRIIFQIQPRFRDHELGPQAGLQRTREFVMADAYSFHADEGSLDEAYAAVKQALSNVLASCGVLAEVVEASSGAMGGGSSEELIAPLPQEKTVAAIRCDSCGYAASLQIAEFQRASRRQPQPLPLREVASVDGIGAAAADEFGLTSDQLKCLPFIAGETVVLAVVPGDLQLNAEKLLSEVARANLDLSTFHQCSADELIRMGGDWDWISLVRTPSAVVVIADESVRACGNFVFPSRRPGHYLLNLNSGRDFRVDRFADIALATAGQACVRCGSRLRAVCGTEIAHLFKLGSRYSAAFGVCIDSARPVQMGCYGLGVTRLMSTIVQQNQDDRGIVWPRSVAPYASVILPETGDSNCRAFSEQLYRMLSDSGVEPLLDDTDDTPEHRFAFSDLLGIPTKIIASGKRRSMVAIQERNSTTSRWIDVEALVALVRDQAREILPPRNAPLHETADGGPSGLPRLQ